MLKKKIRKLKDKSLRNYPNDKSNEINNEKPSEIESLEDKNVTKNETQDKKTTKGRIKIYLRVKRYRIQEVIKPVQVILIQVIKEERGQKGAALTYFYFFSWKIYCFNA